MRDLTTWTDLELVREADRPWAPMHPRMVCAPNDYNQDVRDEITRRLNSWVFEPSRFPQMLPTLDPSDPTECRVHPDALSRLPLGVVLRDASCAELSPLDALEATGEFIQYQMGGIGWMAVFANWTVSARPARNRFDHGDDVVTLGRPFVIGVADRFIPTEHIGKCARWYDLTAPCTCLLGRDRS